jgi:hypothetical protein
MARASSNVFLSSSNYIHLGLNSNTYAWQSAEKLKILSFRGTVRAEESLFSWVLNKERFLASPRREASVRALGMTP